MSPSEAARQAEVLAGRTVVANKHRDPELIAWAESKGLAEYIGRGSAWGNPYRIGPDGGRDEVCDKFDEYLGRTPVLLGRVKSDELSGKVLVCFCKPARCHGDTLARVANGGRVDE